MQDMTYSLVTNSATLRFGGLVALSEMSIKVRKSEVFGLVGPNGAGKTTLLNAISGVFPLTAGEVIFEGRDITPLPLYKRTAAGIGRTFQGVELFADLSVQQNLMVGRHHLMKAGILDGGVYFGRARREELQHRERVEEIIEFFELERYRNKSVGTLAYGIQKIVGLARALCSEPRLLLLDEVASGLNRDEKEDLARFILRIKHSLDITIIWVEHDMRMVSELADNVAVLDYGKLIATGSAEEVLRMPEVRRVFIGGADPEDVTRKRLQELS